MPQQAPRTESGWASRDYWVDPPKRIPPKPPFEAWVPPGESIAIGDEPRDTSRYQTFTGTATAPLAVTPPPPPKPHDQTPQLAERYEWALRDYDARRDVFSILATPRPPPPNNQLAPLHNARPDWTLRDYTPFQPMGAWFESRTVFNIIPVPESFMFEESARDMTAYQLTNPRRSFPGAAAQRPPPFLFVPQVIVAPYDLTAAQLAIQNVSLGTAFAGIPKVPAAGVFVAFDYEPPDLTPYINVFTKSPPQQAPPQIPPSSIPFIEWPGWQWGQYQALQDQFSALGTPSPGTFPKGLRPTFTLEALIRDESHPTSLYTVQTFRIPPPPPRVFPSPPTFLEWRQWAANEYPNYQDMFSAWASLVPPPQPFLVQAVTAGWYNGYYIYPGDVFLLNKASDFSDSSVDYSAGQAATPQFGWMRKVPAGTAVFYTETTMAPPNFPVIDPVPPKRFVY